MKKELDKKIYLAIPYSGYEEKSFNLTNQIASELLEQGYIVYSPISMAHPISQLGKLKGNWEVWKKVDFEFIDWCDKIIVINFDEKAVLNSIGVQEELKYAKEKNKEIVYWY